MTQCIATILIGDASRTMWEQLFAPSWRDYCQRHGYELVVLDKAIDPKRGPNWQRLLLAGHPDLQRFERIHYLDHDILISPHAPAIDPIPDGRIGAVTWQGSYRNDPVMLRVFQESWRYNNARWVRDLNPQCFADLMVAAGFPAIEDHCNTGFLSFQPQHADGLRFIFDRFEPNPRSSQEQAAVTWYLCGPPKTYLTHPVDRRYNAIYYLEKAAHYPFLDALYPKSSIIGHAIDAMLRNCYFLHFAAEGEREHARTWIEQTHLRPVQAPGAGITIHRDRLNPGQYLNLSEKGLVAV